MKGIISLGPLAGMQDISSWLIGELCLPLWQRTVPVSILGPDILVLASGR